MRLRPLIALSLATLLVALGSCAEDDGRTLPLPDPNRTTTTTAPPEIQPSSGGEDTFTVQSTSFTDGGVIPEPLTCTGASVSPDLSWTGTPPDAVELALVVRDRDAGGFVHWVVTGISPSVQGFAEGGIPEDAVAHRNDAGTIGWVGPCPPAGSGTHTYELVLHALVALTAIPPDATAEQAAYLIEASSSERAVLTGTVTAGG